MSGSTLTTRPIPAVGIVCLRGDDVLLVKRAKAPRKGEWSLPGGRIELGEGARDAGLRELAEETNVCAEITGLVDVVDAIFRSGDNPDDVHTHYVLIDFAARWTSGTPRAGDDAAEARFFAPSEVPALGLWDETVRVIDAARALV
ncbi:MAG: NUDIX hydrolase [Pseudomonadota bacterium]